MLERVGVKSAVAGDRGGGGRGWLVVVVARDEAEEKVGWLVDGDAW